MDEVILAEVMVAEVVAEVMVVEVMVLLIVLAMTFGTTKVKRSKHQSFSQESQSESTKF